MSDTTHSSTPRTTLARALRSAALAATAAATVAGVATPAAHAADAAPQDFTASVAAIEGGGNVTAGNATNDDLVCFATAMSALDTRTYERFPDEKMILQYEDIQSFALPKKSSTTVRVAAHPQQTGLGVTVGCIGPDSKRLVRRFVYAPAPLHNGPAAGGVPGTGSLDLASLSGGSSGGTGSAGMGSAGGAPTRDPMSDVDRLVELRMAMVKATNDARAAEGVKTPLAHALRLDQAGQPWAEALVGENLTKNPNDVHHQPNAFGRFPTSTPVYQITGWAENIAQNNYGWTDPVDVVARNVVKSWMDEKFHPEGEQGHYRNIINPALNVVGHGVSIEPDGSIYVVQEFVQAAFTS